MKKQLYTKLLFLFALLLTVSTSAWADAVTLTAGTNGSACTVNEKAGIKVGTSSKGGSMSITVPANTTKLSLHAAAWKGVTGLSLNITGGTASPASISLNPDNGISNNSPFTLAGNESVFLFEITLSGVTTETTLTFTSSIAKRFVVWDASAVVSSGGGDTPTLEGSDLALTGAPITLSFDLYNDKEAKVINYTTSSTGAVTVSASEYVEAVVNEAAKTITVTPLEQTPSEQTITVSQAADETYKGGTVEFTVSVANSAPYVQPTDIDIALNNALFGTTYNGSAAGITNEKPLVGSQDHVTVTYAGSGNHYVNNSQIRLYPSNELTFEAPSGYKITKIVFTEGTTWTVTITADSGEYMDGSKTWEGDASSVVFTGSGNSGHCQMTKAAITLAVPSPLASIAVTGAPTTFHLGDPFSHEGAVVTATYENETTKDVTTSATFSTPDMTTVGEKTVTVSYTEGEVTKTADYTINVLAPAVLTGIALSGEYPTVFNVGDAFSHEGMIVTASYDDDTTKDVADEATFTGYDMSAVGDQTVTVSYTEGEVTKTATYDITLSLRPGSEALPYTVAQARAAIDANAGKTGVYVQGIVSEIVTPYSEQHGNISYNISADGTTEGEQLQAYRGKNYDGEFFTSANDIQVGDKVVIYGNLTTYGSTYEFAAGNKLVSLERANFITDAANATWVAPAKVKVLSEGVKVYTVTYDDAVGCTRKHEVADKVIPANEAVLLTSSKGAATVKIAVTDDEAAAYADLENDLLGSDGTVQGDTNIFCLAVGDKGLGFYPVSDEIYVPAGKAYLLIPATQAAPSYIWFNGDTTAIDSLTTDTAAGNESGEIYSLTGQRVGKNYRGIVIMNGRKVLKK